MRVPWRVSCLCYNYHSLFLPGFWMRRCLIPASLPSSFAMYDETFFSYSDSSLVPIDQVRWVSQLEKEKKKQPENRNVKMTHFPKIPCLPRWVNVLFQFNSLITQAHTERCLSYTISWQFFQFCSSKSPAIPRVETILLWVERSWLVREFLVGQDLCIQRHVWKQGLLLHPEIRDGQL